MPPSPEPESEASPAFKRQVPMLIPWRTAMGARA